MIWEVLHIWIQFFYALLLFVISFLILRKYRENKLSWETPDFPYIHSRYQAKKLLNSEKENWLKDLQYSVSELIVKELDLNFISTEEETACIQVKENKIKKDISYIWKALQSKVPKDMENRQDDLLKALIFELDSGLIQRPSDLLGRRRSHRLKKLLYQELNNSEDASQTSKLKNHLSDFKRQSSDLGFSKLKAILRKSSVSEYLLSKKVSTFSIFVKTVVMALALHCYDFFTDCWLIKEYYEISHERDIQSQFTVRSIFEFEWAFGEFIEIIPVNATSSEVRELSIENTFSLLTFFAFVLVFIVIVSFLLIISQLKTVQSLYDISKTVLICSETERRNNLDPVKVLHRFNFSRVESGTESSLQLAFQMAIYLVMTWQLDWMATKVQQEKGSIMQISRLWPSFAMSILSISVGQLKTRMVLHEFSTDLCKKMIYFAACILNTIFTALIWISLGMAAMDLATVGCFDLMDGGGIQFPSGKWGSWTFFVGVALAFLVTIIIPGFTHILRLPTSSVSPDITSLQSEESLQCFLDQFFSLAVIISFNAVMNIFLLGFAKDALTPALLDLGSRTNFTLPEVSDFESQIVTPSTMPEANARRNFILLSIVLMPLCLVGSLLLLYFYFKDNTIRMRFQDSREKPKKMRFKSWQFFCSAPVLDGFWVDVTELKEGKEDGEILNENNPLGDEKCINQAMLDSVLRSLPFWKGKRPPTLSFKQLTEYKRFLEEAEMTKNYDQTRKISSNV
eukprot:GFUD01003938.1.p1 GENE.GFUD01003938.1~~GFUD01003938.1.p1  ORF type:complete len:740 (+),score=114.53 GFUD01003938.1:39-2258(+)